MLVERLGDDVGGAGEDRVELGVVGGRDAARATLPVELGVRPSGAPSASAASWPTTAGERVDVDLDELAGVLGDVAGLGDDEGDRLADEAHVAVGEHAERPCRRRRPSKSTHALADVAG